MICNKLAGRKPCINDIKYEGYRSKRRTYHRPDRRNIETVAEPVSACYIQVIEETIDDLTDEESDPLSLEKIVGRIRTLRMMKKDIEILSGV